MSEEYFLNILLIIFYNPDDVAILKQTKSRYAYFKSRDAAILKQKTRETLPNEEDLYG